MIVSRTPSPRKLSQILIRATSGLAPNVGDPGSTSRIYMKQVLHFQPTIMISSNVTIFARFPQNHLSVCRTLSLTVNWIIIKTVLITLDPI